MKSLKSIGTGLLAVVLLIGVLLASGCSTPKIAATVDGTTYTTGEYLAYLYNSFYQVYVNQGLYYYDLYGGTSYDVWNETYTYDDQELDLSNYIVALTQDSMRRQVAVQRLMSEFGITISDEDAAAADTYLQSMSADAYLDYGFSNESYGRMYREYNYNESTLFYTLYGEGGQREVPADEIRTYFDDNYVSYKAITVELLDDDGNQMSDEAAAAVTDELTTWLETFEKSKDFDAVISGYNASHATEEDTDTDTDTDSDSEETTETETDNRQDVNAADSSETELMAALKEMAFGEAKVVSYTNASGTGITALLLRMDPEADRGNDDDGNPIDYFANQQKTILYKLRFEAFNEEVEAKADSLEVTFNKRAVKAGDPYNFRSMFVS